ncbi:uncharacterized protein A1O5_09621 [Cladophialophora psammophila CBS 110553]|uniref:Major facilitator superfamily (MFS) profile domain-containing protein n=1 Tax=Cladophialophora psammophila CBS 110553 TaxID=1182543 RepID=W9WPQ3_9EURO|nr:uncharacterized protein A1O5_09621 [Cladophialophora psammophila CBS 110553]EXJ66975.1 hypothetical protein A1O5_09621 [Cladophialophora psammophila CBS 110553]
MVQSATGGYDGSMLNGLNILPSYTDYFNLNAATTGLNTASVFIGGFFGPLVSGIIADRYGRRPAVFWGSVLTLVGILLQTAAQNIAMFVVARIVLGFGSAVSGIAGSVYLAETFPSKYRAWGVGTVLLTLLHCRRFDRGWHNSRNRSMAVNMGVESTFVVPGYLFTLVHYHIAIHTNANGELSDPVVLAVYKEIVDTLNWEKENLMTFKETIKNPISRKRLLIGMSPGPFSCIAGNIIASYYLGPELDTAGITNSNDQLKANVVLNVWCLACALGGTHLAARWGRKPTAILSQCLLIICLFIIGGLSKMYADNPDGASHSLVYGDVAVMFLFQGFYSIAWTPLLYLYPPEIMNYAIRANGLAFSSFMLNALAVLLVFIMPIGLNNIGWKMYIINGSWDIIVVVLIVVFWVETKGRTLEEIDAVFEGHKHSDVPDVELVRTGKAYIDVGKVEREISTVMETTKLD